jgi:hypothetical protein
MSLEWLHFFFIFMSLPDISLAIIAFLCFLKSRIKAETNKTLIIIKTTSNSHKTTQRQGISRRAAKAMDRNAIKPDRCAQTTPIH